MLFDAATLRYDDRGLIPVIAQDADSDEVLMMAWMNSQAVERTLASGRVTYWSRSRSGVLGQGGNQRSCAGIGRSSAGL